MAHITDILIIDDNASDRQLCRIALEAGTESTYSFCEAGNGKEALARIQEKRPDCVLLDYSLPGDDGIEVLKHIRSSYLFLPIVMLTGHGNEAMAVAAIKNGAQNYIVKSTGSLQSLEHTIQMAITLQATQQQIADDAQHMQAVLNTVADGIITVDEQAIIRSFNPSAERIFGYGAGEVIGCKVEVLAAGSYHTAQGDYFRNRFIGGSATIGDIIPEINAQRKDGRTFPVDLSVSGYEISGKRMFVGIIRDITERYEMEKAREQLRKAQKMESIGQLTGGIAHDFNNLLAVVLGNLDLLQEHVRSDDPLHEYIRPSIEAAERGSQLTQQLLAFGRKQALQPEVILANDLLYYLSTLLKHTLGERIETVLSPAPDLWPINVDVSQLQSALLNLAVNARDAMPDGGKLIFETKNITLDEGYEADFPDTAAGEHVMIAVSDTGEGMSRETMEKAFEPFFTTKEVGKGSGLGLSMVHGFVKQSAGHIRIYSEPGHGTSIKIYLPRAKNADIAAAKKGSDGGGATDELLCVGKKSQRILVVEDNKEVLKLTSSMVQSLGYDVLLAENGDMAMLILEEHPDIILLLTDVMLPGVLNGPALAKRAVGLYPKLKVLFNSGYAEHAIRQSGLLEEGVHLLGKPFRRQQLAAKIAEIMDYS